MKKRYLFATFFAISLLAACDSENEIKPAEKEEQQEQQEAADSLWLQEEDIYNNPYTRRKSITLDNEQKEISSSLNTFSWRLFTKTFENKKETNLLLSPFSLTQNLMMLSNGLRGNTLEEIKLAFGVSEFEMEELNRYVLQMNQGLEEADSRTKYRTDNSVWYRNNLVMRPEFTEPVGEYYKAETFPSAMDSQTLDSINTWTYQKTFGRIKDFLSTLRPETQAVMVNTVYFRGQWFNKLSEKHVRDGVFRNESGTEETAKLVMYHGESNYSENYAYQATTRSLGNKAYAMDFILPKEGVKPENALKQYIQDANPGMYTRYVKLDFPRFESGTKMGLNEVLKKVGITHLFQPENQYDFCIFNEPSFIDVIQQETSISVSEKGVEAAAATANVSYIESGETTPPDTVYMKLERPFFYTIRETSTNTPLFIGYQGSVKK